MAHGPLAGAIADASLGGWMSDTSLHGSLEVVDADGDGHADVWIHAGVAFLGDGVGGAWLVDGASL